MNTRKALICLIIMKITNQLVCFHELMEDVFYKFKDRFEVVFNFRKYIRRIRST